MAFSKKERRLKIRKRVRKNMKGTQEIPRLSVFRSNNHISGQLINDINGVTIISASSRCKEIGETEKMKKTDIAKQVGKLLAERAVKAGVDKIVFDRNGFLYHGRVKAFADGARENGLKF